jgi:hypothetical protein
VDVRAAALALLRRALPRLTSDPSLLLDVAECDWPDSRAGAVELARQIDWSALTLDAVLELLDSSHAEVQGLGRDILRGTRERWDPVIVLSRLLEHPSAAMRPFVLEQTEAWLGGDLSRLPGPVDFLRKVLFDLAPSRAAKSRAIELLAGNGERDESLARLAVPILGDLLRTQTRQDFEEALAALLRIHLAFPNLERRRGSRREGRMIVPLRWGASAVTSAEERRGLVRTNTLREAVFPWRARPATRGRRADALHGVVTSDPAPPRSPAYRAWLRSRTAGSWPAWR